MIICLQKEMWSSVYRQNVVICTMMNVWSSAHDQHFGHQPFDFLYIYKNMIICLQKKMWSSVHSKRYDHIFTDKSVNICSQNLSSAYKQKCCYLQGVPKKALQFLSIRDQSRYDPDPDHISIGPGLTETVTLFLGHTVHKPV